MQIYYTVCYIITKLSKYYTYVETTVVVKSLLLSNYKYRPWFEVLKPQLKIK